MAGNIAVSPAGGSLRGWRKPFPLYNFQQLAFKMVYRNCLNPYHLKSNRVSCSEIIFFIIYAVHPLYPPPAGDIALFPLPAGDIAVSPAGGGLRGWRKPFPLYNFQQLAFKMVYRNCLNWYHLKSNRVSCSESSLFFILLTTPKKPQSGFIIITAGESRRYRHYTTYNRKAVAQKITGLNFVKCET